MISRIDNLIRMLQTQWMPFPELRELQNRKLRRLVLHAYRQVPFYRRLFDSRGLKPEDIGRVEDLSRLPTISKEQLQVSPVEDIIASGVNRSNLVELRTSGSTGLPLNLSYYRRDDSRLNASWLRPLLAHGVRPWHKKLEISGPHNLPTGKKWYQYLGLWRRRGISIFSSPEKWVKAWRRYRPGVLYGYAGSLKLLAGYVIEKGIDDIRPRFVFGVSDLVDEECRELIRAAFSRPIIDLYGAVEAGCVAWECPCCPGYHINADTVIVEFLRQGRPVSSGEPGNIVITNLHSFAMPIIRYELEDVGARSEEDPRCGRGLPLMKVIEGRSDAVLTLPSGRRLSPMFFFGVMKKIEGIKQWRIIQTELTRIRVEVVPGVGSSPAMPARIRKKVEAVLDDTVKINLEIVDKIPRDPSGKVRAVVSKLKSR